MKLVNSTYLQVNIDPSNTKNTWRYLIPQGIQLHDKHEFYKIYAKKMVYRNDFPVISESNWQLQIDGVNKSLKKGSPTGSLLCKYLSTLHSDLQFAFDLYDGRISVTNKSTTVSHTVTPLTCKKVLGLNAAITVAAGQTAYFDSVVDLGPPSILALKWRSLVSTTMDLVESQQARTSNVLAYIGNDVVPYGTKVYLDQGTYSHRLQRRSLNEIELELTDGYGQPLYPQSPMLLILCLETWHDDDQECKDMSKQMVELMKLQAIGQDIQKKSHQ